MHTHNEDVQIQMLTAKTINQFLQTIAIGMMVAMDSFTVEQRLAITDALIECEKAKLKLAPSAPTDGGLATLNKLRASLVTRQPTTDTAH